MRYAHIDEKQLNVMLSTKHVHAAATVCEVYHLLPSDFLRRRRYVFSCNAVIGAEKQVAWMR